MRITIVIPLLFLLSCSNAEKPNPHLVKIGNTLIDTSLTAEEQLRKGFDLDKGLSNDGYTNPIIESATAFFQSNKVRLSNRKQNYSPARVLTEENLFYLTNTTNENKEDVIVMNYLSSPKTFFIDNLKKGKLEGKLQKKVFLTHRRKIISNGYEEERYVITLQTKSNKVTSIKLIPIDSQFEYLYQ